MTHLNPGGPGTAAPPTMISRHHAPPSPNLDGKALHAGIASRRQSLLDLEAALVASCEMKAVRGRASSVRMDDRETWDRATWNRYLAAAAKLEPEYGPVMRKLLQEMGQLTRLAELPVAREQAA